MPLDIGLILPEPFRANMKALHPPNLPSIKLSARKLFELERSGKYESALDQFGDGWAAMDFVPDTAGLDAPHAAELLLRFGALIGFYCFKDQIQEGHERSKDLVMTARDMFSAAGNVEKVAECEAYLAVSYWRLYQYSEALVWTDSVLAYDLPSSSPSRLYAHVIVSLVLQDQKRHRENVDYCLAHEKEMREFGSPFLNGSLSTNTGLSYKNLGDKASAMKYLTLARHFHELSGHKPYLGTVQNNLAQLHKEEGRFHLAHEAADAAIKTYRQLKDRAREGSTLDTRAQIYLAERSYTEAEKAATASIALLKDARNTAFMSESLMTRSVTRLRSDNVPGALDDLIEAVNITKQQNGEEAANLLITNFAEEMKRCVERAPSEGAVEASDMELILPRSLSHYSDYKGLWINSVNLEHRGIAQGALAVVTPVKPLRGDLIAISENGSGAISCGTYDYEFGIVCLDRGDREPILFDENDVEILGKIIGYCDHADQNGKLKVRPLRQG
jgi:tetratricopeptide (TPR) repeat protein